MIQSKAVNIKSNTINKLTNKYLDIKSGFVIVKQSTSYYGDYNYI